MLASKFTRQELERALNEMEFHPQIRVHLNSYLRQYVYSKELSMVKLLLNAGADPNPRDDLDCYLHHLLHEYLATKTTSGVTVLELMEVLLEAGANPNRVWCNNLRAYDYAVTRGIEPIAKLLRRYGAEVEIRKAI